MLGLDPISLYVGASFVALVVAGGWAWHRRREAKEIREKVYGRDA